jgi:hypothetical protein
MLKLFNRGALIVTSVRWREKSSVSAKAADRRNEPRVRTHLRTGKVYDQDSKFLADCMIFDRSERGRRLKLFTDVVLPDRIRVYDDGFNQTFIGTVAWRRRHNLGLRVSKGWF